MLKINPHMLREPVGGHHYTEYAVTFKGKDVAGVIKALLDFRVNNNIPVGYPEQDVLMFYVKNFPYMVQEDHESSEPHGPTSEYVLWREWIYGAWRRPPVKFASSKVSSERWEKCLTCPMHMAIDWVESDESRELSRRSFMLRRGIDVPKKLGFCRLHRWDCGVAVFIDNATEFSSKKEGEELEECWVKQLI